MATAATLNPETALKAERQQQNLAPDSYLDANQGGLYPVLSQYHSAPELYAGQGEDATARSPSRKMHKKSGSLRINGSSKDNKNASVFVERYEDKDGEHLVSAKQAWDGQKSRTRRNSVLLSGRRAGAGWEQSQYDAQNQL